jgi:hypothetical protein
MVRQILPNNNESATGIFPKKFWGLNKAISPFAIRVQLRTMEGFS